MASVLHVTECYDGGTGRAMVARVRAAPQHTHHVLWAGAEAPSEADGWASVTKLPLGFIRRVRAVQRKIAELSPDIVHAHSSWAGVYTRAFKTHVPIVYEAHCFKFEDPTTTKILRKAVWAAEARLARCTSAIGVLSPYEAEIAHSFLSDAAIIEIPNLPTITTAVDARTKRVSRGAISMVGRISSQKDPRFFLAVREEISRIVPGLEYRWIGDGDPVLRRELEAAGVKVTGWLSTDEVRESLTTSAVYLHTAAYEGFPLSVLDAAFCQVPIVVRRIPSMAHTTLRLADDVGDAAEAVVEMYTSDDAHMLAQNANSDLLRQMSMSSLESSLESLYTVALIR